MKNVLWIVLLCSCFGFGCAQPPISRIDSVTPEAIPSPQGGAVVVLPVENYLSRRTSKGFGEYIQDRFRGYHVADDIEYVDVAEEVPVVAIASGTVRLVRSLVSGYGGAMRIEHQIAGKTIQAIYGHLDLQQTTFKVGDHVTSGQQLAVLGEGKTRETDGERKHLHFGLYEGLDSRINGYESSASRVKNWINPQDFFMSQGLDMETPSRQFDPARDLGGEQFHIQFTLPENMEVEYIPSIQALNIFDVRGAGTARERSQVFIRFFDADQFLTLSTVTIYKTEDVTAGKKAYTARRYEIEKKSNVPAFVDQPTWRNGRHTVTDVRGVEGQTRYYVVAANPKSDPKMYQSLLDSLEIVQP